MKKREIRAELLYQHAEIRGRIEEIRRFLQVLPPTGPGSLALRAALRRLAETIGHHNEREEALLRDILPTVDAWGPLRAELMLDDHAKEHEVLHTALVDAIAAPDAQTTLSGLLDRLSAHMAHEERLLLTDELLSDDGLVRESFGG